MGGVKLSTKSTYGLRAMVNIALGSRNSAISITDIAKREGISVPYLEQLLNTLRREGLIESVRGPKGGYMLSRSAEEITVADIVKTLEGSIYPVNCITNKRDLDSACKRRKGCVPKIVWHKLAKAINDCLESVTLEDLRLEAGKVDRGS